MLYLLFIIPFKNYNQSKVGILTTSEHQGHQCATHELVHLSQVRLNS